MNQPMVSVIVPCLNEASHIESCLRAILAQEGVPGGVEVIVADGFSDDGTRGILRRLEKETPGLRVIDNPGLIAASGLNAAIRIARGQVILRIDAHTDYAPDYVAECLAALAQTGADNVGGPLGVRGRGYTGRAIAAAFQAPFAVGGARRCDPSYQGELDTVTYGCWPRDVFERVGEFDEEFARNEDDEFNLRLTRAGGRVWQSPRIRSWYEPRTSLWALLRQQLQFGYWKVRVIQKHKIPASIRHVVPGLFVLTLIGLALAALVWPLAGWLWLGLMGVYLAANVVSSAWTAARCDWALLPMLPLVIGCFHFGYGYGFLRGIWSFVLWRGGPAPAYVMLTRWSAKTPPSEKRMG